MAFDKTKLETVLNEQPILLEEKKMWYRLGFYIYPNATTHNSRTSVPETYVVDAMGNKEQIDRTVAYNMRLAVLAWWEVESKAPRANEKGKTLVNSPYDSLDELEAGRG